MPWQDHVGSVKTSEPLTMDQDRIRKFALGIAETGDRPHAPPLSVATVVIPATGNHLVQTDIGGRIMRIVHGGIDLALERPVVPGDVLSCVSTFDGIEEKSTGELIQLSFDVQDSGGASVARGVTRYFVRAKKKNGASAKKSEPSDAAPEAPAHEVTETVPEGQSLLYAEGSGDTFPIHTDSAFARSVGLPDVILHGMCTLAFAVRAVVTSVAGGDSSKLKSVSVRFAKMVFHGDELTTRIWTGDDGVRFQTTNQRGETVLTEGVATGVF